MQVSRERKKNSKSISTANISYYLHDSNTKEDDIKTNCSIAITLAHVY